MMRQTITIERVDHIGVRVHDLDRALAFYRVLGFDLLRRSQNDDVAIIRNAHGSSSISCSMLMPAIRLPTS